MQINEIRKLISEWYSLNKRELPWRGSKDTYTVWLSEIILQQTRIIQGTPYYLNFINRFPDVYSLAKASEDEVLKLWQGLGYYSRARNLHHTAKTIASEFNGTFPKDYKILTSLKGIGKYTASIIMSICFDKPYPVLDGNAIRVISRIFGINTRIDSVESEEIFHKKALLLLDKKDPGEFNQAIMDLGALVCTPNPSCNLCSLQALCYTYINNAQEKLPVKSPKPKLEKRYIHYFVVKDDKHILLNKRKGDDIWKGLYDFPSIEGKKNKRINNKEAEQILNIKEFSLIHLASMNHLLTHRILKLNFYLIILPQITKGNGSSYLMVDLNDVNKFAVPKPVEKILKQLNLVNPINAPTNIKH